MTDKNKIPDTTASEDMRPRGSRGGPKGGRGSDGAGGQGGRAGGNERHGGRHGGRGGRRRLFDYGDLRLMVLALIKEQPSHGYELIKAIEERAGGSYAPSPGVMYPTLAWLEDMGYAAPETDASGRKEYNIKPDGEAHLAANKAGLDALFGRLQVAGADGRHAIPARVMRGMESLKYALRQRFRAGDMTDETIETIAAALDTAAQTVEKSE